MTAFGGALTDPTRIMGSRVGAYIVDTIIAVVVVLGVFAVFDSGSFESTPTSSPLEAQQLCHDVKAMPSEIGQDRLDCVVTGSTVRLVPASELAQTELRAQLATVGFGFLNYVLLTSITGGTLGKRLFGLRVVTAHGQRAGFFRNLVRWAFLIVDAACCFLPGLITASRSKGHRRIGDMVAGTYVVHRSAEGRLLSIPGHLVVRNRQDPYVAAANPQVAQPILGAGTGIDAPVFDASRNTYVRYDQGSGAWFQWDDRSQSWIPAQQ